MFLYGVLRAFSMEKHVAMPNFLPLPGAGVHSKPEAVVPRRHHEELLNFSQLKIGCQEK